MRLYLVGTFDTKAGELSYARQIAEAAGVEVITVDVSTRDTGAAQVDVSAAEVAKHHPSGAGAVLGHSDRGTAVAAMATALASFLVSRDDIGAVLGMGGTGNTALVTEGMRALPVGIPKLMLSTVASGNTAPYVGPTDISMMASVVDIAGLNTVSRKVIANAARAAAGMAQATAEEQTGRPAVGMTMFGVTTDCVTAVRRGLEDRFDACVFHATGIGGQSMEKLAESGLFRALIDLTTTEVPDLLVGGVFAASDDRFGAAIRTRLPYIGSVGACDMVNFGARDTVPAKFSDRLLHIHNANVTLMRTTPEENTRIGRFIVERVNQMEGPVRFLLPLGGVSAIDAPDQPFYDTQADTALFEAIRSGWVEAPNRRLIEVDANINDPQFVDAALNALNEIC